MNQSLLFVIILLTVFHGIRCLVPPKFQWKYIDFRWPHESLRTKAIADGSYIPENNMPSGLARWKDKLFITIPRWKKGVPFSLNYVLLNGTQSQPLRPYPSWREAFVTDKMKSIPGHSTVVSAFRVTVDDSDRLWVVDNGVKEMASGVQQIADPAILVFDLNTDQLIHRYVFGKELRHNSVLTSIVVDDSCRCDNGTFAYITDMGSNAVLVYSVSDNYAWRFESPYFHFDPNAGVYRVGGVDFYWSDGVSSGVLSTQKRDGGRDLYVQPTSSTKTFKIPNNILMAQNSTTAEQRSSVEVVGDRGPNSQATACDLDRNLDVMFFTQLSKNGVSCWNMEKPFNPENTPLIISDCHLLEFPNDLKVDNEGNLWILSNRQSRFLYAKLDVNQINFRVLTAPTALLVKGSTCAARSSFLNIFRRKRKSNDTSHTKCCSMSSINRQQPASAYKVA